MLERQSMFKQSQEHQRQKGLQESDDPREQNAKKQPSLKDDKCALLNIGIRVRDPSQMFVFGDTNWARGSSNQLAHSDLPNPFGEAAGALTKHVSQQAGIFSKSFLGNQTSGSVNLNLANLDPLKKSILFNKEDGNSLGTKSFKKMVAKTKDSAAQEASNLVKSGNHPQPRLYSKSPNFPAPSSSGNAFELLHKVEKVHTYSASTNRVPKSESNDAFNPSFLNKPSQSRENDRLSEQNDIKPHLVLVKKEYGQTRSMQPAKIQSVARVEQNPSVTGSCEIPSTSYPATRRIRNTTPVHLQQQLDVAKPKHKTGTLKTKKRKFSASQCLPWHKAGSLKSKERKFPAFERLPWHKEVTEGSSRLHYISSDDLTGKHSVVRRPKKLKNLADSSRVNRKERLDLTTQLMQRLFQPPPDTVLSQDPVNHCDTVAYYASRLALGDACSLCVKARRTKTSNSSSFQDLSKTIKGFIDRSKSVENSISRLEKHRSTIREVTTNFQDLDEYPIFNRLVKLHLQRPMVTIDMSSTTTPECDPQRHVKTCAMPEMVPEGQDCILL